MRRSTILPATALLAAAVSPAAAQDGFAAFVALNSTPVGALPPIAPTSAPGTGGGHALRYGRVQFARGVDAVHNVGLRFDGAAGRGRMGWTISGQLCSGCVGLVMGGVDLQYPLRSGSPPATLRP